MTELATVFEYDTTQIRTLLEQGEPWFVASDIARLLIDP